MQGDPWSVKQRAVIIIDIGKTLAKASLWASDGRLIARDTRPNARLVADRYAALDIDGIEAWLIEVLAGFAQMADVGAIIPVGHGAAAVLVKEGHVALPPMDYEASMSLEMRADYDALRSPFTETGSPSLPDGLNLGAQLYHLQALHPEAFAGAQILPWAQYWSWLLSGVAASEVTSLGCHTDLWNPASGEASTLARKMGWAAALPSLRKAGDVLGPIRPELAARTGLPDDAQIHTGVHDSNAALLAARAFPEIACGEATVLSTGTWFVAMRTPDVHVDLATLPEERDCLVNVDVFGQPVPSARWMGGREIEAQIGVDTRRVDIKPDQAALLAVVPNVISAGAMLLPGFAPGCGPFPGSAGRWINQPDDWFARRAAVCLYAAMVTNVSLDLVGARRVILIEGRFAEAEVFVRALASLRPEDAIYVANAHNDVSFGALRLLDPDLSPAGALVCVEPLETDLAPYHARWTESLAA
jgi:sugar (pentulose or hexulose) kinase